MSAEKLEKLTTPQLMKRDKEADILLASLIIFLVCFIGLWIIKPEYLGVTIPLLAPAIIGIRVRKKIIKVLIDRIEKQDKELRELKAHRE